MKTIKCFAKSIVEFYLKLKINKNHVMLCNRVFFLNNYKINLFTVINITITILQIYTSEYDIFGMCITRA